MGAGTYGANHPICFTRQDSYAHYSVVSRTIKNQSLILHNVPACRVAASPGNRDIDSLAGCRILHAFIEPVHPGAASGACLSHNTLDLLIFFLWCRIFVRPKRARRQQRGRGGRQPIPNLKRNILSRTTESILESFLQDQQSILVLSFVMACPF